MYPDPNVPRHGKSLYKPYITWVFMGKLSPRIPRESNKYHGYIVRGTPNCPLKKIGETLNHQGTCYLAIFRGPILSMVTVGADMVDPGYQPAGHPIPGFSP